MTDYEFHGQIPAVNLPALQEKIKKLNRRAARLGCEPIKLVIGPVYTAEKSQTVIQVFHQTSKKVRVPCHDVTVTGTRPKLPGGWSLAARVQLLDGISVLHSVPDVIVPPHYHYATNQCDHCQTNRQRNDVFVIQDQAGKFMVVGRNCIADFLGGISPSAMAWYAESLAAIDCREFESYEGGFYRGGAFDFDVEAYLTAAACVIRLKGWIAKSAVKFSGGMATADYASDLYNGRLYQDANGNLASATESRYGGTPYQPVRTSDEDHAQALAAIAWAQAIDPATANDYLINVHKVADLSFAPWNLSGIAASIVSAYLREQGKLATQAREKAESNHVGTVGKRTDFILTVQRINTFEGQFGTTRIHTMRDAAGNVFKWFASRENLIEGETYTVTGTVKRHSDYQGVKQTELSRCKAQGEK